MWFCFVRISLMIIDHDFFCVIKIFDWISFAIRWIFYLSNLVLQTFVECSIYQTWIDYIVHVVFLFVFNDYEWRWKKYLIKNEIVKIFSQQWNVKYRINVYFFRKIELERAVFFFQTLKDFIVLWSSFLDDLSIWIFLCWQSHLIVNLIIWDRDSMSVNIRDLDWP
jgi:hypothetical protein